MDLTKAEDIKKRWQEYTEELYKKDLHSPDNQIGMITHLEADNLDTCLCVSQLNYRLPLRESLYSVPPSKIHF